MMQNGYGTGDGGSVVVSLRADNGGKPATTALWTGSTFTMGSSSQVGKLIAIGGAVTAGQRYWLVFSHVGGSGSFSLNCIYVRQPTGELSARFSAPWTMAYTPTARPGPPAPGYTPVLDLGYSDGFHEGNGYIELLYGSGHVATIGGSATASQTFTVSSTMTIHELGVRALLSSGSAPLVASLQTSSGSQLASVSLAASQFAAGSSSTYDTSGRGGYGSGPVSVTLTPGSYRLVLSSSSSYTAFAIMKGTAYGYTAATRNAGSSSLGSSYDFQFYLR